MTAPATRDNPVGNPVPVGVGVATMPGRNGGRLLRGGNHSPGRLPDRIKRVAQKALLPRVRLLGHLADGVAVEFVEGGATQLISPTPGERIRAIEALHKIGMGSAVNVANLRDRLRAQIRVIRETLPSEQADALLAALHEVWR